MPLVLVALFAGPSVAGILMTGLVSGRAGLRELLSRLLRWRVRARWYAAALLPAPFLVTTALLALSLLSPEFIPGLRHHRRQDCPDAVRYWVGASRGRPLGGARLDRVRRAEAEAAVHRLYDALIVGLLHGAWHFLIALWAGGSFSGGQWTPYLLGILFFYLGALPAYRVLMVWVYDRTTSLVVAMLMHASLSASTLILQPPLTGPPFLTWNLTLTAILWVVVAAVAMVIRRTSLGDNRSDDVRRERGACY